MKNFKFLFILVVGLGITSCGENFLDSLPNDQLSGPTFWQTERDAKMALAGAYRDWEDGLKIVQADGMSDNEYNHNAHQGFQLPGNGRVNPNNVMRGKLAKSFQYNRIRKYNDFLENIEDVEMDNSLKELYKAEVRFLRAHDYFYKVMYWGDMPLVTKTIGPDEHLSRDPASNIKQFILDELDEISGMLPVQNIIESQGRITSGAAIALKARLELYMGRFEDAMTSSKAVIDMGVYELFPDYEGLFHRNNNSINTESIAEVQYVKDVNSLRIPSLRHPAYAIGYAEAGVTKSMVDTYETSNGLPIWEDSEYDPDRPFENRDPRLDMTIVYSGAWWKDRYYSGIDPVIINEDGSTSSNPDYHLNDGTSAAQWPKKYLDEETTDAENRNYDANIMLIRLGEMYLTYAEAAVETGQNMGLGLQYINILRERAGHIQATELTRELVRRERRVELAFEGLRLFDIKRWDIGPEAMAGPIYGSRRGSVNFQTGEVTWEDGYILLENKEFYPERNYLFPIPQSEIDVNPNMTQNPGY